MSQIIGTNQVRTDRAQDGESDGEDPEPADADDHGADHRGKSRTRSDWRIPPAMPRYHAARYASLRLPLSARKAKNATVDAKSASPV